VLLAVEASAVGRGEDGEQVGVEITGGVQGEAAKAGRRRPAAALVRQMCSGRTPSRT
jgi:hypothetical protein